MVPRVLRAAKRLVSDCKCVDLMKMLSRDSITEEESGSKQGHGFTSGHDIRSPGNGHSTARSSCSSSEVDFSSADSGELIFRSSPLLPTSRQETNELGKSSLEAEALQRLKRRRRSSVLGRTLQRLPFRSVRGLLSRKTEGSPPMNSVHQPQGNQIILEEGESVEDLLRKVRGLNLNQQEQRISSLRELKAHPRISSTRRSRPKLYRKISSKRVVVFKQQSSKQSHGYKYKPSLISKSLLLLNKAFD